LFFKYKRQFDQKDINLLEHIITSKSWWDTIDFIASNLAGHYFKLFPDQRWPICEKWLLGDNIWLHRSALLFQLKYKTEVDTELLKHIIRRLLGSNEFFINKAIGWMLREYSKTNPDWVLGFVERHTLHKLSRREALKWLDKNN
jgi:3-methyladenine DNA glycosylase AlkD